jgi:hypothetical protein
MATKTKNKSQVVALTQQLIAGTAKHLTGTTQVQLVGSSFTSADITAKLQSLVTLESDVNAAEAATKAKLATRTANMPSLRTFESAYVAYLKVAYKGSPDVLADFGIQPPKVRVPLTVEAKAAAAAKRAATRAARHTMGSQQKKAVKGDVTGIVVTPVTAAPPSVTTPAPAGSTSGGTTPVTVTTHSA